MSEYARKILMFRGREREMGRLMLSTYPKFIGYFHLHHSKLVQGTSMTQCVFISSVCDGYLGEDIGFGIKIDSSMYSLRPYIRALVCL